MEAVKLGNLLNVGPINKKGGGKETKIDFKKILKEIDGEINLVSEDSEIKVNLENEKSEIKKDEFLNLEKRIVKLETQINDLKKNNPDSEVLDKILGNLNYLKTKIKKNEKLLKNKSLEKIILNFENEIKKVSNPKKWKKQHKIKEDSEIFNEFVDIKNIINVLIKEPEEKKKIEMKISEFSEKVNLRENQKYIKKELEEFKKILNKSEKFEGKSLIIKKVDEIEEMLGNVEVSEIKGKSEELNKMEKSIKKIKKEFEFRKIKNKDLSLKEKLDEVESFLESEEIPLELKELVTEIKGMLQKQENVKIPEELKGKIKELETLFETKGLVKKVESQTEIKELVKEIKGMLENSKNVEVSEELKGKIEELETLFETKGLAKKVDGLETFLENEITEETPKSLFRLNKLGAEQKEILLKTDKKEEISPLIEKLEAIVENINRIEQPNKEEIKEVIVNLEKVSENPQIKERLKGLEEKLGIKKENLKSSKSIKSMTRNKEGKQEILELDKKIMKIQSKIEKEFPDQLKEFIELKKEIKTKVNKTFEKEEVKDNKILKFKKKELKSERKIKKYGLKTMNRKEENDRILYSENKQEMKNSQKMDAKKTSENKFILKEFESIVNQVKDGMKIDYNAIKKEMNIKLTPEDLGTVKIRMTLENDIMKAEFIVENEKVKAALESNFNLLKEKLNQKGIETSEIKVNIESGNNNNSQNQNEGHSKKVIEENQKRMKKNILEKTKKTETINRTSKVLNRSDNKLNVLA